MDAKTLEKIASEALRASKARKRMVVLDATNVSFEERCKSHEEAISAEREVVRLVLQEIRRADEIAATECVGRG